MNTDRTGFHTYKECHKTESLWNHTTTDHKEGEQLGDRRSVGTSSCNSGDGTDQRVQSLMFMMIIIYNINVLIQFTNLDFSKNSFQNKSHYKQGFDAAYFTHQILPTIFLRTTSSRVSGPPHCQAFHDHNQTYHTRLVLCRKCPTLQYSGLVLEPQTLCH